MHLARIIMQLKGMERKGDIDEATFKHLVRFLAEKFIEQQTVDVVNQEIETNIDQVLDNHLFKPLAEVMLR